MGRPRGFTLIEGVFSLFIIFLVLTALAYTLKKAGNVKSNLRNMGDLAEVAHAVSLLRKDIYAARQVTDPGGSGSSTTLSLLKVDSSLRLQDRISDTEGAEDLDPFGNDELSQVQYFAEDGFLKKRQIDSAGMETLERLIPCEQLNFFRSERPDQITVQFTVRNSRRPREHTVKVALR